MTATVIPFPAPVANCNAAMNALLTEVDLVSPFGRGIEANSCLAETRAALAFFRQHYGELPWGMLAVQGRA